MWQHAPDGMVPPNLLAPVFDWILSEDLSSSSLGTWRSVWPSMGFRYHPHAATGDEGCRKDEQRKVSDSHKNKNRNKSSDLMFLQNLR